MFSVTNKTKHFIKQDQISNAIWGYSTYIAFGYGSDICIYDKFHTNPKNYNDSNFGKTYDSNGLVYGSEEAKSYLAGEYWFKVKELEVYRVFI